MKTLIDARYLSSVHSGIGVYCEHLLTNLSLLDSESQYTAVVHSSFERELSLGENFEVIRSDARPVSVGTLYGALDPIFEELQPDVLHATFPLVPNRWEGATIVTVHDLQPFTVADFTGKRNPVLRLGYDLFYRWSYQAAFNRADVILSNSLDTKRQVSEHFPLAGHRTLCIRMGLDPSYREEVNLVQAERTRTKYRLPDRYIHFVGSTRPNKNIPRMLGAFADYIERSGDEDLHFVLIVARDRFFVDAERVIAERGIAGRVSVFDQVKREELRIIHACSSLLFFATECEGFGFPILEAQACGVPVIAGDDGAAPEVAGNAAYLVNPRESEEMVDALEQALAPSERRDRLIAAGIANSRIYSWEETARSTLDVYQKLFDPSYIGVRRRAEEAALSATSLGARSR